MQALVVEPGDPFDDGQLQLRSRAPDAVCDRLGPVRVDEAFGQALVIGVADRRDALQYLVVVELLLEGMRDALERLLAREDFTQREDYVFGNRLGGRLDGSALRRRYHAARKAAGLRHVKLHGLCHCAGSLVARHTDAVFVQHFLGHAKLAATERSMRAKARAEDIEKFNAAFGVTPRTESEP